MEKSFFKAYSFWIIFIVVFSLAFIGMGAKRTLLSNSNNVADWLPEEFQQTQEYKWFLKHFPYESFIVVSWKGCTLDDERLDMFADKLIPGRKKLTENASESFTEEPLSADVVVSDELINRVAGKNVDAASNEATEDATSPLSEEEEIARHYFKAVVTGPEIVAGLKKQYPNMSEAEIFRRLDGVLIGPDYSANYQEGMAEDYKHRNTGVIVTLGAGAKGKELAKVIERIKQVGRECGIEPPLPEQPSNIAVRVFGAVTSTIHEIINGRTPSTEGLVLGGPPIDNVAITFEGERTLYRLAGICALFGFVIAYSCLRNALLSIIVFWIAILGAGISLSFVSLSGQHCDAILLSMPALVYVLTMSGAIHMINYYFDEAAKHGLDGAPERMVKHAWYPCTITSVTTALGLASLYSSHLVPIIKFGVFSAIGVIASLSLLFLYLPALLYFFPVKKYAKTSSPENRQSETQEQQADPHQAHIFLVFWRFFGGVIIRNNKLVAVCCLCAMVFFAYGISKIITRNQVSVKMMRFFSADSEIIAHYTWLEEQLGPLVPMEVVVEFDNEKCGLQDFDRLRVIDQICNALREKLPKEVGGVMSASTVGPSPRINAYPGSFSWNLQYNALNRGLKTGRAEMKDFITVEKVSFDQNTAKTPEELAAFEKRLKQMGITKAQAAQLCLAELSTIDLLLYDSKDKIVPGIAPEELENLRLQAEQWQEKHGKDLWRISLRVWSLKKVGEKDIDYALFVEDVKGVVETVLAEARTDPRAEEENAIFARYTGMVPLVYQTQHELLQGLVTSFFWSFVSIAVVMMFVLKSPVSGFLAMLPNLFPICIVFGCIGHLGILVDVGMMMSASVALGIAVDDTIHYLTWFREGVDRGLRAKEAAMEAYEKCATAMTETTFIAGFGLSAFAFSTFTPTQTFGIMMLAILFAALMGDLIFLPAILTGPAGKFFCKRSRAENKRPRESAEPLVLITPPPADADAPPEEGRYLGHCHFMDRSTNAPKDQRE